MKNKYKTFLGIEIHEVGNMEKTYIATCQDDCRDKVDLSAFQLAMETMDMITMGCVIAVPVWSAE